MKIHEFCAMFPDVSSEERKEMALDIQERGQYDPIWTYKKEVIDGKNRLAACEAAGVEPKFKEWKPTSKQPDDIQEEMLDFVISKNLKRRHMNPSQLAMVGARIAEHRAKGKPIREAVQEAAEEMGVSPRQVDAARIVLNKGSKKLQKAVDNRQVSVNDAVRVARQPAKKQDKAVRAVQNGSAGTAREALAGPLDEALAKADWTLKNAIPGIQEAALIVQRALGAGAGQFSAGVVGKHTKAIYDLFDGVSKVLKHAKVKGEKK